MQLHFRFATTRQAACPSTPSCTNRQNQGRPSFFLMRLPFDRIKHNFFSKPNQSHEKKNNCNPPRISLVPWIETGYSPAHLWKCQFAFFSFHIWLKRILIKGIVHSFPPYSLNSLIFIEQIFSCQLYEITPLSAQTGTSTFQNLSQIPLKIYGVRENRGVCLKHPLKISKLTHSAVLSNIQVYTRPFATNFDSEQSV